MLEKVKEKAKALRKADKKYYAEAKEGLKIKVNQYRSDPKLIALVAIEVILIFLLILSIVFLFDPNLEFSEFLPFIQDSGFDLSSTIPWELKLALFIVTVYVVWKLYSYTGWYRKQLK